LISLDFNYPVFDCSTCSALFLELFSKLFEFCFGEGYPGYQAYPAALAAFGLPAYPHHTVALLQTFLVTAAALLNRMSAARTGSTRIG